MNDVYEECRANLEKFVKWCKEHDIERNEATTRIQLIDRLFMECLGWSRDDIIAEESHAGEFADYTFLVSRRVLIVEAKKEGIYFEVPAGMNHLEYSLKTLLRDNPALREALEQVGTYCQTRGVSIGAVCNGRQLVAFVATRNDGVAPFDGRALVFPSPDFMLEHFLDLWQAMSKAGIQERKLFQRLLGDTSVVVPPKLSTTVAGYPGIKIRNIFQTDLQILSDLVLEDISRSRDLESTFLSECYCESGALSQYSMVSKMILKARYKALFDSEAPGPTTVPAVDKEGISSELLAESLSRRPILIIGDVGVGKTTFIRYLVKVDAVPLFDEAITLYIDLGSQATLTYDLHDFVLQEMWNQLRTDYGIDIEERNFVRGIYYLDLERFGRGVYSDLRKTAPGLFVEREIEFLSNKVGNKAQHLKNSLGHIAKGRKKQIVIFIDNADQRQDDIQQKAFLIAQELAEHWPATVFVTLRPETFHRSLKLGTLSGYHPKAFTISPPRIDQVLTKRLEFALKITSGHISVRSLDSVRLKLANLDDILHVFLDSITWVNNALIEFIDNICGGNVRIALDLVRSFLGSGHVDTEKIIEIYKKTGSYYVPIHEFLRAVLYGDSEYYDPSRTPIANLYDVSYADPKEHFLLPVVLAFLTAAPSKETDAGFVELSRVYEHAQGLGYTPEQVDTAIMRAYSHKLIETSARRVPLSDQPVPKAIRATTIGAYHVSKLCRFFTYLDSVVVDTPIFDDQMRKLIEDVQPIDKRLDRCEIFRAYLDSQWRLLPSKETFYPWPQVSQALKVDIQRIRNRLTQKLY